MDISRENITIGIAKVLYKNGIILQLGILEFIGNKMIANYNNAWGIAVAICSIYQMDLIL